MAAPIQDEIKLLLREGYERIGSPPGGISFWAVPNKELAVRVTWRRSYNGILSDERELEAEDLASAVRAIIAYEDEVDAEERRNMAKDLWDRDEIQFPRLLAEMVAIGVPGNDDVKELCESMNLEEVDIAELLDRAQAEWERLKEQQRWS